MSTQEQKLAQLNEQLRAALPLAQQLPQQITQLRQTVDELKAAAGSTQQIGPDRLGLVDDELATLEQTIGQITTALTTAVAPLPVQGQGGASDTSNIDPSIAGATGPGGSQHNPLTGMPQSQSVPAGSGVDAQRVANTDASNAGGPVSGQSTAGGTSTLESPGGGQTAGGGQRQGGDSVLDL